MATKKAAAVAIGEYDNSKWQAEDDMRTLARAQEVMANPRRLAAAKKCAKEKLTEMQAVASMAATK